MSNINYPFILMLLLIITGCTTINTTTDSKTQPTPTNDRSFSAPDKDAVASRPEETMEKNDPISDDIPKALSKKPSKLTNIIEQRIVSISELIGLGATDVSSLSDSVLHIKASGDMELVFHSADAITESNEADLTFLDAYSLISTRTLSEAIKLPGIGQIQAWIPYAMVEKAAAVSWVVAVTPPGYGETNVR